MATKIFCTPEIVKGSSMERLGMKFESYTTDSKDDKKF